MAEKQLTQQELMAMKKPQLVELATKLHIPTKGLKKIQLLTAILGQVPEKGQQPSDGDGDTPSTAKAQLIRPPIMEQTAPRFQQPLRLPGPLPPAIRPQGPTPPRVPPPCFGPSPPQPGMDWHLRLELQRLQWEAAEREKRERLQMECAEREKQREYEFQIARLQAEQRDKDTRLQAELRRQELALQAEQRQQQIALEAEQRQKELAMQIELERVRAATEQTGSQAQTQRPIQFRVQEAAKLLPKLANEQEIETYIITFEKIAGVNKWPEEHWPAILQTQLRGKALKVFAEMSDSECTDFETLKARILEAYELCPEHYRKKFRSLTKQTNESYADFAFKLTNSFKRWLEGLKAFEDIEKLKQTILMEQFMDTLSSEMKLWLADREAKQLDKLARYADQFVALRKSTGQTAEPSADTVLSAYKYSKQRSPPRSPKRFQNLESGKSTPSFKQPTLKPPIRCKYCKKPNHTISECRKLQRKKEAEGQKDSVNTNSGTTFNGCIADSVRSLPEALPVLPIHPLFVPFCSTSQIIADDGSSVPVKTLRDTAALQSLLLESSVPPEYFAHTGEVRLLKGIARDPLEVPLVELHLKTDFIDEKVLCGLVQELPEGVDFLLGNDVWFRAHPITGEVNAVETRAQSVARKSQQIPTTTPDIPTADAKHTTVAMDPSQPVTYGDLDLLSVKSTDEFKSLQQKDRSINSLASLVEVPPYPVGRSYYFMENDILMHHAVESKFNRETDQLVVPTCLRNKILFLAHDIPAAGHLGVAKTRSRIWPHFYWPHMAKEITAYCRSCDICQRLGKGQKPAPAPLIPLPVISEPFSRIAIDIVGPLPTCPKSGNRFILTVMDMATHYPEAIPLQDHTAKSVAQALATVFAHFGFPEEILSDQGTDLVSELMQIFLHEFKVTQIRASAYHPQTNGCCERFHRTLKSMFRANSAQSQQPWDEVLPWVLFAYREIPVETLGFSPFEMLFGRNVRGPLQLVKSGWKPKSVKKLKQNVLEFMLNTRESLKSCHQMAETVTKTARTKSKTWYDRKARERSFDPGQLVLVCLPVRGNPLEAKYCGPYKVLQRIGPVDYEIATPDRRKTQRICHINMLKAYVVRDPKFATLTLDICITDVEDRVSIDTDPATNELGPSALDVDTGFVLDHLDPERKHQLNKLLSSYTDIFSDKPGRTNLCTHKIELQPGTKPIRLAPYRANPQKTELIQKELDLMIQMGVIEGSNSPWAAPVVIVPKPDGSARFCNDFRRLNNVTVPDAYPMPRIDDLIDKVGRAKFITKLDLSRGYWQVPMDEESIPLTAFVTPHGQFQWRYMPFGLRNAPATFQRLVRRVLAGLETFTGAYLDDIIIFSSSWSEHLKHISLVFDRIRNAGLTIKKSKCVFATAEVEFLGHKVGLGKVEPRRQTVKALLEFPRPTNPKQLRSYLGLVGYYRRFIPHFADLSACLTDLLRKGSKFEWTDITESAFLDLKSRLTSRPILRPPDFDKPFMLAVDASNVAIGANLFQLNENIEHPVCFYSKRLNRHQQRYSTVEKEALGLVLAVRVFSPYFGAQPVTVYTDHSPLQFIQRMANHNQKLLRWTLELQQFNLKIVHRPGKLNLIPDILSRPPNAS